MVGNPRQPMHNNQPQIGMPGPPNAMAQQKDPNMMHRDKSAGRAAINMNQPMKQNFYPQDGMTGPSNQIAR